MKKELYGKTISRISKHIQNQYFTEQEIIELSEHFPEFVIYSDCFRAYDETNGYGSLLFWSKSEAGIIAYLENSVEQNNKEKYKIITAKIKGIDLNSLLDFLNNHFDEKRNNPYSNEEEILAISIENIKPF